MKDRMNCTLLLLFFALAMAPTAKAADPLKSIPNDAFLLLRFASADQFSGGLRDMLTAIGPVAAAGADEAEEEILGDSLITERALDAIDRAGPIYIAIFSEPESSQDQAVFVQTKDRAALVRALANVDKDDDVKVEKLDNGFERLSTGGDAGYFIAERGDYLVYTRNEKVADLLSEDNTKMKSFAGVLDAGGMMAFHGGDASVAVNITKVVETYKDEIAEARDEANKLIDTLPAEQLGTASPEATKKLYKDFIDLGFAAVHDAQWVVGNVTLDATGGAADVLLRFKKGSGTDKWLAASPPSPLENLGLLPSGAPMYFGFKLDYGTWLENYLKASFGDNAENAAAITKSIKQMAAADVESIVASYALPKDDKTGIVATMIEEAADAKKLLAGWRGYIQAVGKSENALFTQKFDYKNKAEKHKGHAIDLFTMSFELTDLELAGQLQGLYDKMFGGKEFQSRLAVVDGLVIQATGNDSNIIRKMLDNLDSGKDVVGLDKAFGKTRDQLREEANLLVMLDLPRIIVDAVNMIRDIEPFADGLEFVPFNFAVQPAASYSGLSISTEPQGVRFKAFVPVEQPKGMIQIFGPAL